MFDSAKDAKAAGNFSRRHRTRDAHDDAVARYQAERGKSARRERALDRQQHGSMLTRDEREERGWCSKATSISGGRRLLTEVFGNDGQALEKKE